MDFSILKEDEKLFLCLDTGNGSKTHKRVLTVDDDVVEVLPYTIQPNSVSSPIGS